MSVFDLTPEPTLLAVRRETYEVDKAAMVARIEAALSGLSATEVMEMIRREEIEHRVVSEDLISVIPRKTCHPVLASYVCIVDLSFEDGRFQGVDDISACGLVVV
ncbi:MAG: hypothetical protein AAGH70_00460 [Pseudomonadota bacterium]